ncbi:MAG: hypothetical protein P4L51_23610 [Puia sp.]|nr:hypothetical protein [Puia sp.]
MRAIISLLLAIAGSLTSVYAQQDSVYPGYVVLLNGDTLRGMINATDWQNVPQKITFYEAGLQKQQVQFDKLSIRAYDVEGVQYVRGNVELNDFAIATEMRQDLFSELSTQRFIRLVTTGSRCSLYEYIQGDTIRFLLRLPKLTLCNNAEFCYVTLGQTVVMAQGNYLYRQPIFQQQLLALFSRYPAIDADESKITELIDRIKKLSYARADIVSLVKWINNIHTYSTDSLPDVRHDILFSTGLLEPVLRLYGPQDPFVHFKSSPSFCVSLGYQLSQPLALPRLTLEASVFTWAGHYSTPTGFGTSYLLTQSVFGFSLGVHYRLFKIKNIVELNATFKGGENFMSSRQTPFYLAAEYVTFKNYYYTLGNIVFWSPGFSLYLFDRRIEIQAFTEWLDGITAVEFDHGFKVQPYVISLGYHLRLPTRNRINHLSIKELD